MGLLSPELWLRRSLIIISKELDREGRTMWIADAHRDGKRFVVHADEKLTAFLELEAAVRAYSRHAKYEFDLSHTMTDPPPTPQRDHGPHALYCGEWPRVDGSVRLRMILVTEATRSSLRASVTLVGRIPFLLVIGTFVNGCASPCARTNGPARSRLAF